MADTAKLEHLKKIATLIRYYALNMTTQAGSGHPTSAMTMGLPGKRFFSKFWAASILGRFKVHILG